MKNAELQLRGVGDARLAVHATSSLPAWLWSIDGTRIVWANPVGARLFDAPNGAALAAKTFGPANPHRRQVIRLARGLAPTGAVRLERLRGFGAPLGGLMTCACARLDFSDGGAGILVVATEPSGRAMPLVERLQRLTEGIDTPIAAFARDGMLVGASEAARALLGFRALSKAGLDAARSEALLHGRVETTIEAGHMVLQRVGAGADVGLVALIAPAAAAPAPASPDDVTKERAPPDLAATTSGGAPAESGLLGEFAAPAPAGAATPPLPAADQGSRSSSLVESASEESASPEEFASAEQSAASEQPPEAASTARCNGDATTPQHDEAPGTRRHPLRFMWQMDAEGRFSLGSDEFSRLIGMRTAAAFGRLWSEIAEAFGLDPEGRVNRAIATRDSWSGVTLSWPVDGGTALPVELSGLPIYDRERRFVGYRGFGVCRDLDGLVRLALLRRYELSGDPPRAGQSLAANTAPANIVPANIAPENVAPENVAPDAGIGAKPETIVHETSHSEPDTPVETPKNVLPFRPANEVRLPSLTPVENNAFNELARQLAERLEAEKLNLARKQNPAPASPETPETGPEPASAMGRGPAPQAADEALPGWLSAPEPPVRGESLRDKSLLDLLPVGVLIYRLDRLLYGNAAFLERIGYASLHALEQAGGLDALFVEPVVVGAQGGSTSSTGTPVTIAATPASEGHAPLPPTEARLFTISWDDESALALVCSNPPAPGPAAAVAVPAAAPSPVGHANAEELGAILDTMAEGVMMFDAKGNINSCNRSAEALFGYDGDDFTQRHLAELFAPESQRVVEDYLESIKGAGLASLLDHGREVLGRVRGGGLIPLSMTMGRTRPDGPNFFAVFRDLSQTRKIETELVQARQQAERSANAKADVLARISHEVRTPLNAIIGFADVMIDERFGALGNERYIEYMRDIRASGERVIAIVNDLLDLSRIETGKIDLAFTQQNLNELVEGCVAVMQPQANRERIIIRTSLSHVLPLVVADARALRQITLNLIGNSIHLANAGGQVIVSTALSDGGEVVLRVRDTGHGLNDNELAAAMSPFRSPADQTSDSSGITLSLTKALVEANRAQFQIRTAPSSGTLIEVVFARAAAQA